MGENTHCIGLWARKSAPVAINISGGFKKTSKESRARRWCISQGFSRLYIPSTLKHHCIDIVVQLSFQDGLRR